MEWPLEKLSDDTSDSSSASLMDITPFEDGDSVPSPLDSSDEADLVEVQKRKGRWRLPPEILSHVLRYAYANSRRQFLNNALVNKEWAACALPVLWERIAPRSNFPITLVMRSLDRIWRTLMFPNQSHDYAAFPRTVTIQLHLKNTEFVSRKAIEDFCRIVELVPGIVRSFPKLRDLGLTLRIEEPSILLQAATTAFMERLIRINPPKNSLWLKLAGVVVLDSQCVALAERFGNIITDFHLTKCTGCTANGLRHFLRRVPRLQSLALYIPSLHDQLLGTIAENNNQLMDLWLDLPMEDGALPNELSESLRNFCMDLRALMKGSNRLRRLRLRGVPLAPDRAHQMLQTVGEEGKELRSLSVLVWPPVQMGVGIASVSFTSLNKLIISSNSKLSNDFIVAVAKCCPQLAYVDAGRTKIDDMSIMELASRCPLLEFIDISRCSNPTVYCLFNLARHAKNLVEFDVSFSPKILRSDEVVPFLNLAMSCKRLKRFCIDYPPAGGVVTTESPPEGLGTASETVRLLFSRFGTISNDPPERKRVLNLAFLRDNWMQAWGRFEKLDLTDERLYNIQLRNHPAVAWWLSDVKRALDGEENPYMYIPPH